MTGALNVWKSLMESRFTDADIQRLKEALRNKKVVWLIGSQGVGKSFLAEALTALGHDVSEPGMQEREDINYGPMYVPTDTQCEVFEMRLVTDGVIASREELVSHPDQLNEWINS